MKNVETMIIKNNDLSLFHEFIYSNVYKIIYKNMLFKSQMSMLVHILHLVYISNRMHINN